MFLLVRVRLGDSGGRCGLGLYSRTRVDSAANAQVTHCFVVVLLTFVRIAGLSAMCG